MVQRNVNVVLAIVSLGMCVYIAPFAMHRRVKRGRAEQAAMARRRYHQEHRPQQPGAGVGDFTSIYAAGLPDGETLPAAVHADVVVGWTNPAALLKGADRDGYIAGPSRNRSSANATLPDGTPRYYRHPYRPHGGDSPYSAMTWGIPGFADRLYLPVIAQETLVGAPPVRIPCTTDGVAHARCEAPPAEGGGRGRRAGNAAAAADAGAPAAVEVTKDINTCGFPNSDDVAIASLRVVEFGKFMIQLVDGRVYVLTPECRPAYKTMGMQGWGQVAAWQTAKLLFGAEKAAVDRSPVACAAGVRLSVDASSEFAGVIRSRCGGSCGHGGSGDGRVYLTGVVSPYVFLPDYQPSHTQLFRSRRDGDPLDPSFTFPSLGRLPPPRLQALGDSADIVILDYLVGYTARVDGNQWSMDPVSGRFRAHDYGTAFGADSMHGSLCGGADIEPPMLPRFAQADLVGSEVATNAPFCWMRRSTHVRLRTMDNAWAALAVALTERLLADPAIQALIVEHEGWDDHVPGHANSVITSRPLARSVRKCPAGPTAAGAGAVPPYRHVEWLLLGMKRRLAKLVAVADRCEKLEGFTYLAEADFNVPYAHVIRRFGSLRGWRGVGGVPPSYVPPGQANEAARSYALDVHEAGGDHTERSEGQQDDEIAIDRVEQDVSSWNP